LINAEILLKRRIETIDELLTLRIKDRKRG
jgi:hypothetical protein